MNTVYGADRSGDEINCLVRVSRLKVQQQFQLAGIKMGHSSLMDWRFQQLRCGLEVKAQ